MSLEYCVAKACEMPFIRDQKRLFAAVLDKRNRIISEGSNSTRKLLVVNIMLQNA